MGLLIAVINFYLFNLSTGIWQAKNWKLFPEVARLICVGNFPCNLNQFNSGKILVSSTLVIILLVLYFSTIIKLIKTLRNDGDIYSKHKSSDSESKWSKVSTLSLSPLPLYKHITRSLFSLSVSLWVDGEIVRRNPGLVTSIYSEHYQPPSSHTTEQYKTIFSLNISMHHLVHVTVFKIPLTITFIFPDASSGTWNSC